MRHTLLELVQSILTSLDGEPVNSINDTVESQQVVNYIRNSYEEIVSGLNLPQQMTVFSLQPVTDVTKPVVMYLPENMQDMQWLKYDMSEPTNPYYGFQYVDYMEPEDFLMRSYADNLDIPNYKTMALKTDTGVFNIRYQTDKHPTYYTTFDQKALIFDSYMSSLENTLEASRTLAYGEKIETFVAQDNFVIKLTPKEFALLENEAKSQAFVEQKQSQDPIAERRARKGWIRSQRQKIQVPYMNNARLKSGNYARKGYQGYDRRLRNGQ